MLFDAILNRTSESPASINPQVPPMLGDVISKALERDRETRYQTAADMRADLKRLRRDSTSGYALRSPVVPQHRTLARTLAIGVGVIAVLALAGGLVMWKGGGEPASRNPWAEHRLRLFLSSDETVAQPSLASDAGTIVYTSIENGQRDIFLSRAAGGARVRVTNDAATEFGPQLSPDGETIIFARLVPGTEGELEICTTPAFGGTVSPIVPRGRHPVWSPDGRRIAFVQQTVGTAPMVAVADATGSNVRVLLKTDATYTGFGTVAWSPDGSQLVVERSMGGVAGEIWMVSSGDGEARRLWQDPPEVFSHSPVFTADGSGIVHSSNRGGATNLWLMFTEGRAPVRLTTGPGPDEYPTVSRTGTLAFSNTRFRHVLLLHPDVSGVPREIWSHSWFLWAPAFSPTRPEIAVSRSEPDGSWHIWMVPLDGAPARRLTSGTLPEIYPRFTPDGSAMTYSTWSPQADRVWTVPRTGGPGTPVTPARDDDDAYADVSPDGKSLAFARTEAGVTRVHIAPFEGGPARRLTDGPSTTPRWSPDSQWIAYSPSRSTGDGIFVVATDGTGGRQLSRTGGWPVWWPDGSRIAYWTVGPSGDQEIQVVPLKGGTASTLRQITFTGTNHPFDVSATGKIVRGDSVHLNTEVWLMEPGR